MREIKYRLWNKKTKEIWGGGFWMYQPGNGTTLWADTEAGPVEMVTDDFEVLEFTGLKDKSGVDIFEGDVLESRPIPDVRFKVSMGWNTDETAYGWCVGNHRHTHSMDKYVGKKMVVIGNIYANPALVKP